MAWGPLPGIVPGKVGGRVTLFIKFLGENTTRHAGPRGSPGLSHQTGKGNPGSSLYCGFCGKKQMGQDEPALHGPVWTTAAGSGHRGGPAPGPRPGCAGRPAVPQKVSPGAGVGVFT